MQVQLVEVTKLSERTKRCWPKSGIWKSSLLEGFHPEHDDIIVPVGRYYDGQCPDIDGQVIVNDVDELGKLPNAGHGYWV
jgi:hypothetical protein